MVNSNWLAVMIPMKDVLKSAQIRDGKHSMIMNGLFQQPEWFALNLDSLVREYAVQYMFWIVQSVEEGLSMQPNINFKHTAWYIAWVKVFLDNRIM